MIMLIGGIFRSGKSTLMRQICQNHGASFLSLDHVMRGLLRGLPQVDFGKEDDRYDQENAEKMWPVTSHMLKAMAHHQLKNYIVEGVLLLPRHIAELQNAYPGQIRGCCLGYTQTVDFTDKIKNIHANPAPDNWMHDMNAGEITEILIKGVGQSREIEKQCHQLGVAFFDTSAKFAGVLQQAETYLTNNE